MSNEDLAVLIVVCYAVAIVYSTRANGSQAEGAIEKITRLIMLLVSLRK